MSTAPGSTLPRPFLSEMSISSPRNVTKNTVDFTSLLDPEQSQSYPYFDRKRMMRRSRSAQGLVGPMSEYNKAEQKIKRKPVPRLSGQVPMRTEYDRIDTGSPSPIGTLFSTQSEAPIGSIKTESHHTSTGTSQSVPCILTPPFLTPPIQDPPRTFYDLQSAPTIPTTFTSGSLNLGLVPSGSGSSLASSYIDTPTKDPIKSDGGLRGTLGNDDKGLVSPTKRYGSMGMKLEQYMGRAFEKHDDAAQGEVMSIEQLDGDDDEDSLDLGRRVIRTAISQPVYRTSPPNIENKSLRDRSETIKPSITSHVTESALSTNYPDQNGSPKPPARPQRPPGLFLDLSHLKPFAINLKSSIVPDEDPSTPASVRLSAVSRGSSFPEEMATTDSSFCALRKDSLDSDLYPRPRSIRSSIFRLGGGEVDGPVWAPAKSGLSREVDSEGDGDVGDVDVDVNGNADSTRPGELEDLRRRLRVLNEEALAALQETPKASLRTDPFEAEPLYQRRNSVIAWTQSLSAEVSPALHSGSSQETVKPAGETVEPLTEERKDGKSEEQPENDAQPVAAEEQLVEPTEDLKRKKTSRGNREERLQEDGRASRTGYWDYSIIRGGGYATPPPPEFFSTFQQQTSPETPVIGSEAAFHSPQRSPGKALKSSPLQQRTDVRHPLRDDMDGDVPPGPRNSPISSPYTPPSRQRQPRSWAPEPLSTPQRLLKYGIDVLTSPVKLLSPKKRVTSSRMTREESGSLLDHAEDMGRVASMYSSASEYGSDNSPELGFQGFSKILDGGHLSLPLFDLASKNQSAEQIVTAKSLDVLRLGADDSASPTDALGMAERLREASIARSPSSNLDSLSQVRTTTEDS